MSESTEQSKAHWKRYENVTVRCEFCVKTFKTTKAYQDHAELNHKEQVSLLSSSSATVPKRLDRFTNKRNKLLLLKRPSFFRYSFLEI